MHRGDPQIRIRVPKDVKSWLDKQAEENVRSPGAEIVFHLRQAMSRRRAVHAPQPQAVED